MLSVDNLRKGFGSGRRRLEVLKGINLKVEKGELVSLMGPSGCGKSTLLNIIGGLLEADSGKISLGSFEYGTKSPNKVVDVRRSGVGWIFQDFHLVERLTALDNVIFSLELSGVPSSEAEDRARNALERVGLGDRMNFIPDQLSGGQQQRVAVARAISGSRSLILADEPTGNLDSKTGMEIMAILQQLNKNSEITVVVVTHEEEIANYNDRVITFRDGSIVSDKPVSDKTLIADKYLLNRVANNEN